MTTVVSKVTSDKRSRSASASLAEKNRYRSFSASSPLPHDPPPVTPYDVIYEGGKVRLRYYQAVGRAHSTPLLLVYALIKRPYIVDLLPDRSIIQAFVRQGFKLYLTDWIPPTDADRRRGFDAYVNGDLANVVREIQSHAGVEHVSLLGYSLGGLLTVLYTALHPETVHCLITLAPPLEMRWFLPRPACLCANWLGVKTRTSCVIPRGTWIWSSAAPPTKSCGRGLLPGCESMSKRARCRR